MPSNADKPFKPADLGDQDLPEEDLELVDDDKPFKPAYLGEELVYDDKPFKPANLGDDPVDYSDKPFKRANLDDDPPDEESVEESVEEPVEEPVEELAEELAEKPPVVFKRADLNAPPAVETPKRPAGIPRDATELTLSDKSVVYRYVNPWGDQSLYNADGNLVGDQLSIRDAQRASVIRARKESSEDVEQEKLETVEKRKKRGYENRQEWWDEEEQDDIQDFISKTALERGVETNTEAGEPKEFNELAADVFDSYWPENSDALLEKAAKGLPFDKSDEEGLESMIQAQRFYAFVVPSEENLALQPANQLRKLAAFIKQVTPELKLSQELRDYNKQVQKDNKVKRERQDFLDSMGPGGLLFGTRFGSAASFKTPIALKEEYVIPDSDIEVNKQVVESIVRDYNSNLFGQTQEGYVATGKALESPHKVDVGPEVRTAFTDAFSDLGSILNAISKGEDTEFDIDRLSEIADSDVVTALQKQGMMFSRQSARGTGDKTIFDPTRKTLMGALAEKSGLPARFTTSDVFTNEQFAKQLTDIATIALIREMTENGQDLSPKNLKTNADRYASNLSLLSLLVQKQVPLKEQIQIAKRSSAHSYSLSKALGETAVDPSDILEIIKKDKDMGTLFDDFLKKTGGDSTPGAVDPAATHLEALKLWVNDKDENGDSIGQNVYRTALKKWHNAQSTTAEEKIDRTDEEHQKDQENRNSFDKEIKEYEIHARRFLKQNKQEVNDQNIRAVAWALRTGHTPSDIRDLAKTAGVVERRAGIGPQPNSGYDPAMSPPADIDALLNPKEVVLSEAQRVTNEELLGDIVPRVQRRYAWAFDDPEFPAPMGENATKVVEKAHNKKFPTLPLALRHQYTRNGIAQRGGVEGFWIRKSLEDFDALGVDLEIGGTYLNKQDAPLNQMLIWGHALDLMQNDPGTIDFTQARQASNVDVARTRKKMTRLRNREILEQVPFTMIETMGGTKVDTPLFGQGVRAALQGSEPYSSGAGTKWNTADEYLEYINQKTNSVVADTIMRSRGVSFYRPFNSETVAQEAMRLIPDALSPLRTLYVAAMPVFAGGINDPTYATGGQALQYRDLKKDNWFFQVFQAVPTTYLAVGAKHGYGQMFDPSPEALEDVATGLNIFTGFGYLSDDIQEGFEAIGVPAEYADTLGYAFAGAGTVVGIFTEPDLIIASMLGMRVLSKLSKAGQNSSRAGAKVAAELEKFAAKTEAAKNTAEKVSALDELLKALGKHPGATQKFREEMAQVLAKAWGDGLEGAMKAGAPLSDQLDILAQLKAVAKETDLRQAQRDSLLRQSLDKKLSPEEAAKFLADARVAEAAVQLSVLKNRMLDEMLGRLRNSNLNKLLKNEEMIENVLTTGISWAGKTYVGKNGLKELIEDLPTIQAKLEAEAYEVSSTLESLIPLQNRAQAKAAKKPQRPVDGDEIVRGAPQSLAPRHDSVEKVKERFEKLRDLRGKEFEVETAGRAKLADLGEDLAELQNRYDDMVVLSATQGRQSDFRAALTVLKNKHLARLKMLRETAKGDEGAQIILEEMRNYQIQQRKLIEHYAEGTSQSAEYWKSLADIRSKVGANRKAYEEETQRLLRELEDIDMRINGSGVYPSVLTERDVAWYQKLQARTKVVNDELKRFNRHKAVLEEYDNLGKHQQRVDAAKVRYREEATKAGIPDARQITILREAENSALEAAVQTSKWANEEYIPIAFRKMAEQSKSLADQTRKMIALQKGKFAEKIAKKAGRLSSQLEDITINISDKALKVHVEKLREQLFKALPDDEARDVWELVINMPAKEWSRNTGRPWEEWLQLHIKDIKMEDSIQARLSGDWAPGSRVLNQAAEQGRHPIFYTTLEDVIMPHVYKGRPKGVSVRELRERIFSVDGGVIVPKAMKIKGKVFSVSKDEIVWAGFKNFLDDVEMSFGPKHKITKEQMDLYFETNRIQLSFTDKFTQPGFRANRKDFQPIEEWNLADQGGTPEWSGYVAEGDVLEYMTLSIQHKRRPRARAGKGADPGDYRPNVHSAAEAQHGFPKDTIGHARLTGRVVEEWVLNPSTMMPEWRQRRILMIEEIQSDWFSTARVEGFAPTDLEFMRPVIAAATDGMLGDLSSVKRLRANLKNTDMGDFLELIPAIVNDRSFDGALLAARSADDSALKTVKAAQDYLGQVAYYQQALFDLYPTTHGSSLVGYSELIKEYSRASRLDLKTTQLTKENKKQFVDDFMNRLHAELLSPNMDSIKDLAVRITGGEPAGNTFMSNYRHLLNGAREDLADVQRIFQGRLLETMPPDDIAKLESILSESRDLNRMMEINESIGLHQIRIKERGAMPRSYVAPRSTDVGRAQRQNEAAQKQIAMLTAEKELLEHYPKFRHIDSDFSPRNAKRNEEYLERKLIAINRNPTAGAVRRERLADQVGEAEVNRGRRTAQVAEQLREIISQTRAVGSDVPAGPFGRIWKDALLKRIIKVAADKGYDGVGIVPAYIGSASSGLQWSKLKINLDDVERRLRKYTKQWNSKDQPLKWTYTRGDESFRDFTQYAPKMTTDQRSTFRGQMRPYRPISEMPADASPELKALYSQQPIKPEERLLMQEAVNPLYRKRDPALSEKGGLEDFEWAMNEKRKLIEKTEAYKNKVYKISDELNERHNVQAVIPGNRGRAMFDDIKTMNFEEAEDLINAFKGDRLKERYERLLQQYDEAQTERGIWPGVEQPPDLREMQLELHNLARKITKQADHLPVMDQLHLNGLTELTPEVAIVLAQFKGNQLHLNGVTFLDHHTAEMLSEFKGTHIYLNGVGGFSSREAFLALAMPERANSFEGFLYLNSMKGLDEGIDKVLYGKPAEGRLPLRKVDPDLIGAKPFIPPNFSQNPTIATVFFNREMHEGAKRQRFLQRSAANAGGPIKGSVEFLEEGQAIIRAYKDADVSTMIHEMGHIIRRTLNREQRIAVETWIKQEARKAGKTTIFDKSGEWSEFAEETFARGFERMFHGGGKAKPGSAQTFSRELPPPVAEVFKRVRMYMGNVYKTLGDGSLGNTLAPTAKRAVEEIVGARKTISIADIYGPGRRINPQTFRGRIQEVLNETIGAEAKHSSADMFVRDLMDKLGGEQSDLLNRLLFKGGGDVVIDGQDLQVLYSILDDIPIHIELYHYAQEGLIGGVGMLRVLGNDWLGSLYGQYSNQYMPKLFRRLKVMFDPDGTRFGTLGDEFIQVNKAHKNMHRQAKDELGLLVRQQRSPEAFRKSLYLYADAQVPMKTPNGYTVFNQGTKNFYQHLQQYVLSHPKYSREMRASIQEKVLSAAKEAEANNRVFTSKNIEDIVNSFDRATNEAAEIAIGQTEILKALALVFVTKTEKYPITWGGFDLQNAALDILGGVNGQTVTFRSLKMFDPNDVTKFLPLQVTLGGPSVIIANTRQPIKLRAANSLEEFINQMREVHKAITGHVDEVAITAAAKKEALQNLPFASTHDALYTTIQLAMHAKAMNETLYDFRRIFGVLDEASASKMNRMITDPNAAIDTLDQIGARYIALQRLPGVKETMLMDKHTRTVEITRELVAASKTLEGEFVFVPTDLLREFESAMNGLIKDMSVITSDRGGIPSKMFVTPGSLYDQYMSYWRQSVLTGILLPNPRYWVNNFLGDWSQMVSTIGVREGTALSFQNVFANFEVKGRLGWQKRYMGVDVDFTPHESLLKLSKKLAEGDKTVLGSVINALFNPRLHDVFSGKKGYMIVDGRQMPYDTLRQWLVKDGVLDSFTQAELGVSMGKALVSSKWWRPGIDALSDWQFAIQSHATMVQQRQRTALYLHLLESGVGRAEARRVTLEALYDWRNSLGAAEARYVTKFLPFWRFHKLAMKQMGVAMAEAWTMPAGQYAKRMLYGNTKYQRTRGQALAVGSIPSILGSRDVDSFLDDEDKLDHLARVLIPPWAGHVPLWNTPDRLNQNQWDWMKGNLGYKDSRMNRAGYRVWFGPQLTAMHQMEMLQGFFTAAMAAPAFLAGLKKGDPGYYFADGWEKNMFEPAMGMMFRPVQMFAGMIADVAGVDVGFAPGRFTRSVSELTPAEKAIFERLSSVWDSFKVDVGESPRGLSTANRIMLMLWREFPFFGLQLGPVIDKSIKARGFSGADPDMTSFDGLLYFLAGWSGIAKPYEFSIERNYDYLMQDLDRQIGARTSGYDRYMKYLQETYY